MNNMNKVALTLFIVYNLAILYVLGLFMGRIHKLYNEGQNITINLFILTALGVMFLGGILIAARIKIKR